MDGAGGNCRLILFHKQKTSARTRFLLFADTALAFGPLPASAAAQPVEATGLRLHPAARLQDAEQRLGLPAGSLEAVSDFHLEVPTDEGSVPVLLAAFTSIDPPFAAAEACGGRFAAITEARGLPPVELALLRHAYEVLIG
jgi:hypothetical protein